MHIIIFRALFSEINLLQCDTVPLMPNAYACTISWLGLETLFVGIVTLVLFGEFYIFDVFTSELKSTKSRDLNQLIVIINLPPDDVAIVTFTSSTEKPKK